jgi:hypothetical protein
MPMDDMLASVTKHVIQVIDNDLQKMIEVIKQKSLQYSDKLRGFYAIVYGTQFKL